MQEDPGNTWEFQPSKFPRPPLGEIEAALRDMVRVSQHLIESNSHSDGLVDLNSFTETLRGMDHSAPAVDYAARLAVERGFLDPRCYLKPLAAGLNIRAAAVAIPANPESAAITLGLVPGTIGPHELTDNTPPVPTAPDESSLNAKQVRALEIIRSDGPIQGKNLAKRLSIAESTLRRHIIIPLKQFGVKNDGDGYYAAPRSAT